jgi:ATP-dependent Zn protease
VTTTEERRRTAYHEAGHAVVGWALGLAVSRMWIEDNGEGRATIQDARHLPLSDQVAVCFGSYAGTDLSGVPQVHLGEFDHQQADLFTLHVMPDDVSEDHEVPDQIAGRRRADEIIACYPDSVRRLAEALIEHGSLEQDCIAEILGPSPMSR